MKKLFFFLMLLTLLPGALLADDITVTPANINRTYSGADYANETVDVNMFTTSTLPTGVTKADIAAVLTVMLTGATKAVDAGSYDYYFEKKQICQELHWQATRFLLTVMAS